GRIDTDAIDNSAGVNTSDIEVNIKIALNAPLRAGQLDPAGRNALLHEMTDEVAALCLANNYLQTLALSLAERAGIAALPDQRALDARAADGRGLTRPELAVLLAYAKNALAADLLAGSAPDDPYLGHDLFRYFPKRLADLYPDAIATHRLRREVIATV